MGFRATRKTYLLVFPEGDPLHGLEITVGGLTLGEWNDMRNKIEGEESGFTRKEIETGIFLDKVTGWNLEDEDGTELEVGLAGFETLNPTDTTSILRAWLSVALGVAVPSPLDRPSKDGDSTVTTASTLASLPMESM